MTYVFDFTRFFGRNFLISSGLLLRCEKIYVYDSRVGQSEMYEVKKRNKHEARYIPGDPTYWYPKLHYGVVHSEILNKHIQVIMTERAQRLIDDVYGLDNYLLKTEVNEIYSHLGLKMKREILLTLANPEEELYPMDSAKRTDLLDQYKDYILPHEEADWYVILQK